MASLKSLIPHLARALGMKPAAIYERQRALVRAGLLEMRPGRGPGSGVPLNYESVAMLLISLTATASLSEVEQQTQTLANLKSRDGRCPFTGQKTFAQALTDVLRNEDLYKRVSHICVERGGDDLDATIAYHGKFNKRGKEKESAFGEQKAGTHQLYFVTFLAIPILSMPLDEFAALFREANK